MLICPPATLTHDGFDGAWREQPWRHVHLVHAADRLYGLKRPCGEVEHRRRIIDGVGACAWDGTIMLRTTAVALAFLPALSKTHDCNRSNTSVGSRGCSGRLNLLVAKSIKASDAWTDGWAEKLIRG